MDIATGLPLDAGDLTSYGGMKAAGFTGVMVSFPSISADVGANLVCQIGTPNVLGDFIVGMFDFWAGCTGDVVNQLEVDAGSNIMAPCGTGHFGSALNGQMPIAYMMATTPTRTRCPTPSRAAATSSSSSSGPSATSPSLL